MIENLKIKLSDIPEVTNFVSMICGEKAFGTSVGNVHIHYWRLLLYIK